MNLDCTVQSGGGGVLEPNHNVHSLPRHLQTNAAQHWAFCWTYAARPQYKRGLTCTFQPFMPAARPGLFMLTSLPTACSKAYLQKI